MATRKGKGKGRQAVRNGNGGFPGWGYAVVGLIAGVILMAVMTRGTLLTSLRKADGPTANPEATAQRGSDPGVLEGAGNDNAPKKPQYDFYSVLSEKEVRIPDAEISAQAKVEQQQKQIAAQQQAPIPPQPQPAVVVPDAHNAVSQNVTATPEAPHPASAGGSGYLLQVGAFPNANDAETLKAKLALQGFMANVQSVNVGGQTYHRVRLGPFGSAIELESTKQRLSGAGIHAIALKEGH